MSERIAVAHRALVTLDELAGMRTWTAVERDALRQRFEYHGRVLRTWLDAMAARSSAA